jgi:hypothetical protein
MVLVNTRSASFYPYHDASKDASRPVLRFVAIYSTPATAEAKAIEFNRSDLFKSGQLQVTQKPTSNAVDAIVKAGLQYVPASIGNRPYFHSSVLFPRHGRLVLRARAYRHVCR